MHIDPSVTCISPRFSTVLLCQVCNRPPGLGFSLRTIVPNINRQSVHSLVRRATAPAKKDQHLRIVVSMLRQRVILRAFTYERVARSVQSRCWKPMTRKKTDEPLEAWPRVPLWGSTSHTPPVKEGVNPVGLQHSNFQTMREIVLFTTSGPTAV